MSFAGSASAHTPSVAADCSGVTIGATAYDAGRANTWTATVGDVTRSGTFGASFSESFAVPQAGATTTWSFRVVGWDGNYDSGVRSGSVGPCGQAPPPAQCTDGTDPGDLDGDGTADADDCGYVAPPPTQCADGTDPGDLDGDGAADADDCGYVAPDGGEITKVTFCHATGSTSNPYVELTTSVNAFYNGGHVDHDGDIWAAFTFVKQGQTISVPAQGDQSLLATGCAQTAVPPVDPPVDPPVTPPNTDPDDQCTGGTNPGDLDGDGDSDAADCSVVLDDGGQSGDESNDGNDADDGNDVVVDPAAAPGATRGTTSSPQVPIVVDAGVGDLVPAATVTLATTGRPFRGGPLLMVAGAIVLGVMALRPTRRRA